MYIYVYMCVCVCVCIYAVITCILFVFSALFGVLFADNQEAAFSNYRMFQAIGFSIAFGYSYFLCVEIKVYIMASVLLLALSLYAVIEMRLYMQDKHSKSLARL